MAEAVAGPGLVVTLTEDDIRTRCFIGRANGDVKPSCIEAMAFVSGHRDAEQYKKEAAAETVSGWYIRSHSFMVCYLICPLHSISDVKAQGLPVIDVDGGCLARKWHQLS